MKEIFAVENKFREVIPNEVINQQVAELWKVPVKEGKFVSPFKISDEREEKMKHESEEFQDDEYKEYIQKTADYTWYNIIGRVISATGSAEWEDLDDTIRDCFPNPNEYEPFINLLNDWLDKEYELIIL